MEGVTAWLLWALWAVAAWKAAALIVCNAKYCEGIACPEDVGCPPGTQVRHNASVCACCDGCVAIIGEGGYCPVIPYLGFSPSNWECLPGLKCIHGLCRGSETTSSSK